MSHKIDEFKRINEPRAQRALDQINLVLKSGASMRVEDDDLRKLLQPVDDVMYALFGEDEAPAPEPGPVVYTPGERQAKAEIPPDATPPVAREMSALEHLTTQQLVDRMIACGAELAKRRQ